MTKLALHRLRCAPACLESCNILSLYYPELVEGSKGRKAARKLKAEGTRAAQGCTCSTLSTICTSNYEFGYINNYMCCRFIHLILPGCDFFRRVAQVHPCTARMFLRPNLHNACAHRDAAVADLELVKTVLPNSHILPRRKNHTHFAEFAAFTFESNPE